MTHEETLQLEQHFGISFPEAYRKAITDSYPFNAATEELDTNAQSLREVNEDHRENDPWGFPWKPSYWCIGGDGAGGFYFINTAESSSTVYYCDHEQTPSSIDDTEYISIVPFDEFIEDVKKLEVHMQEWEDEMKAAVLNRKWWQFWIPRKWPS